MSKIAVVYWSGTGNTEAMANAVVDGVKAVGVDVELFQVDDFEPFFTEAEEKIADVPVGLFGSYGWGGGAWMEAWTDRTRAAGAKFIGSVIAENSPEGDTLKECEELGKKLAEAV